MKLAKRISFFVLLALIFGPWVGYIIAWMMDIPDVSLDEIFVGVHVAGIIGMMVWCIIFLKANPRLARTGLILAVLFLAFWAFALFS